MRRRLLFLVVCAGLSLAGMPAGATVVRPDQAPSVTKVTTTRAHVPSAPRGLVAQPATAGSASVSWRAPAKAGSSPVGHYRVLVTIVPGPHHARLHTVPATKRSTTFTHLRPGLTFEISVQAVSRAGRGRAARIRYTVPQQAGSWVFAVNTKTDTIVRVPVAGGALITVAPHQGAWTVDPAGDIYSLNSTSGTLTRVPASGPAATVIARGFTAPGDVQLDAQGRVYVVDQAGVTRLTATGADRTLVAPAASGAYAQVAVAPDGTVSTVSGEVDFDVATYPATGGPVVHRSIQAGEALEGRGSVLADAAGNLYVHTESGGGSGYDSWFRLAPGSTTTVYLATRDAYYAAATDPNGSFHLIQTLTYCDWETLSDPESHCVPDPPDQRVNEFLNYAPDHTRSSTAIKPFTFDRIGGAPFDVLAVDGQGRFFLAQSVGPSAGILKYRAAGGAPIVLSSGTFTEPHRNN